MKKLFSLFAALTVAVSTILATDVTFTFKTDNDITYTATGTSGGGAPATVSKSNVILEGSNAYTTSGKTLSCYGKSTLKITAPGNITNIAVTYNGDVYPFTEAVPTGKTAGSKMGSGKHQATYSPATPATSVTLNNPNTGKTDLLVLAVTYTAGTIVNVTGVTLDQTSATLTVGQKLTLTATVAPADATNKLVNWTSDNETVATVANGIVSAKKEGTAKITATTVDGHKTATCDITVIAKTAPVGSIFFESFDAFDGDGGNDGVWSDISTTTDWTAADCDNEGWTTQGLINEGSQCVSIRKSTVDTGGTSVKSGVKTPAIGKAGNGKVQFLAESWGSDTGDFYVDILGGGTFKADQTGVTLSNNSKTAKVALQKKGEFKEYNIEFENATEETQLLFYMASGKRGFLDEVAVWVEPKKWDGTVSLSKTEFRTLADLEGLTLTFNDATAVTLAEEPEYILFQNEDGSEMYAIWSPAYEGTYNVEGNVVTLNNWYAAEGETSPLPAENGAVYFEDYGTFSVDGEDAYFETVEASYIAPVPTTYTVTYSVTGLVAEYCRVQAGYINADMTVSELFVEGENTVPEDMYAYVYAQVIEDYTVEVKVNGEIVELAEGIWNSEDPITEDMTIDVVFRTTPTAVENIEAVKATKVVKDGQVMIIRDSKTYNVMGIQF